MTDTDHRPRLLAIMGSGETAPTMVKTHRGLLERLGPNARAIVLDTPYGFQENAPELAARATEYFRQSVGHPIEIAGLTRLHDVDPVELERGLGALGAADYVFAGPGSPTYALRQWSGTRVPSLVRDKLRRGGGVTFASAAALTLGRVTVPVYEIYKVGEEPRWLEGLDLLSELGISAAVIPHYDNAEGGHHDTRFCYLGERRLRALEEQLPPDTHVIGVDEHTGVVIDLDDATATVVGNGVLTVRVHGHSTTFASGTTLPIDALRDPASARVPNRLPSVATAPAAATGEGVDRPATSLAAEVETTRVAFDAALSDRDAAGAVRAALALEAAITSWSADTLQSDEVDRARAALRAMIVRLGDAAVGGLRDPREVVGPFVDGLVALRTAVRAERRFDLSDLIRDRLAAAGVEVRDTRDGVEWELRSPQ